MIENDPWVVGPIRPEETWPIRASVLWPEKEAGPDCFLQGDDDTDTFHLGAWRSGELVSIATFMRLEQPEYPGISAFRLRAMGTVLESRGIGVGRAVIEKGLEILSGKICDRVWCDARHVALGFYARLDWDVTGATYSVPHRGPHRRASRSI